VCLTLGVGVDPQAVTIILVTTSLLSIFQHSNIRTPRWLGYIVQRPESHTVHHGRGVHARNYSDLPIFDILFGTFENPAGYELETGFYDGASARVIDMLLLRDVTTPASESQARPVTTEAAPTA
jgi:sterol desaturase/sphingolipid hydroxylase (fatty acid hydroxylase superfamily)